MGFLLNLSRAEWLWIILAIGLVLAAEIFNTAIEKLTDLVQEEKHPKAGQVKDLAAGAVLVLAITALLIGIIIFVPRLMDLFDQ
jgi:diacylglycerol kinase (ATP)